MSSVVGRFTKKAKPRNELLFNRIYWCVITIAVGIYAWISGERILYLAFAVLVFLPIISLIISVVLFKRIRVTQSVDSKVHKNMLGNLVVHIHNATPMPFGNVQCILECDPYAMEIIKGHNVILSPFRVTKLDINFRTNYRGHFNLGIKTLLAVDICGLFRLKKHIPMTIEITSLPIKKELTKFPLAMQLLSQAHSRHDIRDEDFATISDVRQYHPTDSIKRVHWKLTAKRNEWMVKVFQSNALNSISIIMDSQKLNTREKERLFIEDAMVEMLISFAGFCLDKQMPVDVKITDGTRANARAVAEYPTIYNSAAELRFDEKTNFDVLNILTHVLNEATGFVNLVIITARLNTELYERIQNAKNNGHLIIILFYSCVMPDRDSENIFELLVEGGLPCYRFTDENISMFE